MASRTAPGAFHLYDAMSSRRVMILVALALIPSVLAGIYRTGVLEGAAVVGAGTAGLPGWRGGLMAALGFAIDPGQAGASLIFGLLWFLPLFAVALLAGYFWQWVFAAMRGRDPGDGLVVIALIFTLFLPAGLPLWQAALGMSFAIVFGREIFGGMGRNFLNPALAGLAFLYASYPRAMVSETMWRAADATSAATASGAAPDAGARALAWLGSSWMQAFAGMTPGAMGNSSVIACLAGGGLLLWFRVASARIMTAVLAGVVLAALVLDATGAAGNGALDWSGHLVMGGAVFAAVFVATDPVTAPLTRSGKWVYGLFIGALIVLIRVAHHSHPDGVIFAVLLGNIFAPLIDFLVVQLAIWRVKRRHE